MNRIKAPRRDFKGQDILPGSALRDWTPEDDRMGWWLSAALNDPKICKEMKDDIRSWMAQYKIIGKT